MMRAEQSGLREVGVAHTHTHTHG